MPDCIELVPWNRLFRGTGDAVRIPHGLAVFTAGDSAATVAVSIAITVAITIAVRVTIGLVGLGIFNSGSRRKQTVGNRAVFAALRVANFVA